MPQSGRQRGAGEPQARPEATFRALADATRQHFTDEERYMRSIAYPEFTQHALIHPTLLEKLDVHYAKFRAGNAGVDPAVFEFLTFWLRTHIAGIDRRYADFAHAGRAATAK